MTSRRGSPPRPPPSSSPAAGGGGPPAALLAFLEPGGRRGVAAGAVVAAAGGDLVLGPGGAALQAGDDVLERRLGAAGLEPAPAPHALRAVALHDPPEPLGARQARLYRRLSSTHWPSRRPSVRRSCPTRKTAWSSSVPGRSMIWTSSSSAGSLPRPPPQARPAGAPRGSP